MKKRTLLSAFARYASLNSLGMLALSCYILADTFFISQGIGADGLTALNLAIPVYNFVYGTGLMIGMGGATLYSIYLSQGNREKANSAFTASVLLWAIFSFFFFFLGFFASESITRLLGADQSVFAMTHTYLKIILLFSPLFIGNSLLLSFVRNDGKPQLSMAGMITGSLGNILLDYIFIFPLRMGIFGAVLATGCAPIMSILVMIPYLLKKRGFHLVKASTVCYFKSLLSTGLPSLLSEMSSGIVMIIFNFLILDLMGNTGVAAYGIIANLSLVVIAIFNGIAQGVQPLFSKACGSGRHADEKTLLRYGYLTVFILSLILYTLIFSFADPIASVFNSDKNTILQSTAIHGLRFYFIGGIFAGLNILFSTYFSSTERSVSAQIIMASRGFVIIIPMAFLLSDMFAMTGIWSAFPAAEGVTVILSFFILYKQTHKNKLQNISKKS